MNKQSTEKNIVKFKWWNYIVVFFFSFVFLKINYSYDKLYLLAPIYFSAIIFSLMWWFLKGQIPEFFFPFLKFAAIPIGITFIAQIIYRYILLDFIPPGITPIFFQLGILLTIGYLGKILPPPSLAKLIFTALGLWLFSFLITRDMGKEISYFVQPYTSDQEKREISSILDIMAAFLSAITYLAFMFLFRLNKSSLKNIGELPKKTSDETEEISPSKLIQSFDNLYGLYEHQVLTDEEYASKKNDLIEGLKDINLSQKPEDFLALFIPLLKNGTITKAEMKQIKGLVLSKMKKDAA